MCVYIKKNSADAKDLMTLKTQHLWQISTVLWGVGKHSSWKAWFLFSKNSIMVKPPEESAFLHPSHLDIDIAEQTADLLTETLFNLNCRTFKEIIGEKQVTVQHNAIIGYIG